MKIQKIKFNEYTKEFKKIAAAIDPALLFKVDMIKENNRFNTYYNISGQAVCCVTVISLNTIELKSLISTGSGAGSALVNHITKTYSGRYKIILDSFSSNNKFYIKNGFKPYKVAAYNPEYDKAGLNKNKEPVIYYQYSGGGVNE